MIFLTLIILFSSCITEKNNDDICKNVKGIFVADYKHKNDSSAVDTAYGHYYQMYFIAFADKDHGLTIENTCPLESKILYADTVVHCEEEDLIFPQENLLNIVPILFNHSKSGKCSRFLKQYRDGPIEFFPKSLPKGLVTFHYSATLKETGVTYSGSKKVFVTDEFGY